MRNAEREDRRGVGKPGRAWDATTRWHLAGRWSPAVGIDFDQSRCDQPKAQVLVVDSRARRGRFGEIDLALAARFQNTKPSSVKSNYLKTKEIELHRSALFQWFPARISTTIIGEF